MKGTWKKIEKELLEIRGESGKFGVIGIKGEKNFEKETINVCNIYCCREAKENGDEGAVLK